MTGSTRAWRRLRAHVLERDGHRCQRLVRVGDEWVKCNAPATHAGHIVARVLGGKDTESNLQAECAMHNLGDAPALAELSKGGRTWTW